jgi:hypothetical protein
MAALRMTFPGVKLTPKGAVPLVILFHSRLPAGNSRGSSNDTVAGHV